MPASVRQLGAEDWPVVRDLRLQALENAPYAFGSSLEREEAFAQSDWREFLKRFAWFVADQDGTNVGVVAGLVGEDVPPGSCEVISMWVAPSVRGKDTGKDLVEAVRQWARGQGATSMILRVADGNDRAKRFYERLGFVPTGRQTPLRRDRTVCADEYLLAI